MFPALLMPALIGGGLGLLTNRKDPLKGALLGAGMGAAGGAFAPGLFGGAGAASGASGAMAEAAPLAFNAAKDSQLANAALGSEALAGYGGAVSTPNLMGTGGLFGHVKDAAGAMKPFGDAAGAALAVKGLFAGGQQQAAPAPMAQTGTGAQTLAQIAQMGQQQSQNELQSADLERKKRRMGLLGVA